MSLHWNMISRIQPTALVGLVVILALPKAATAQTPPLDPPPAQQPGPSQDPAPAPDPPPPPETDPDAYPGPGQDQPPGPGQDQPPGPGLDQPPGPGPDAMPPPPPPRRRRSRRRTANNTLFAELGGPGGAYSLNYERMLPLDFGLRAGVSYLYVTTLAGLAKAHVLFVPLAISYNGLGRGSHALELAVGATITYCNASAGLGPITFGSESGTSGLGTFSIGYRFQPRGGGIQFRFGFSGLFGPGFGLGIDDEGTEKWRFLPWAYASGGWTF